MVEEIKQDFDEQGARRPIVRRREDGIETVVKEVQELHVALVSACPLEEFGLPALDRQRQMAGELGVRRRADLLGPLVVFTPALRETATVLDPIVGRERAQEEARAIVARRAEGLAAGLLPGAEVDVERLGEEATLLFYPVRLTWFRVGGPARTGRVRRRDRRAGLAAHGRAVRGGLHRRALGLAALAAGFVVGSLLRRRGLPAADPGRRRHRAPGSRSSRWPLGAGAWWLLARARAPARRGGPVSAPRFLPLACPRCSDDLAGRAVDRVAFCRACGRAYRVDGGALADLPARRVTLAPPGDGALLALPFWLLGPVAIPAFLGARPLTLARIATRSLSAWRTAEGLDAAVPFGRARAARLGSAGLPAGAAPGTPRRRAARILLAVPARVEGGRFLLPGDAGTLYPDDLHEGRLLAQL